MLMPDAPETLNQTMKGQFMLRTIAAAALFAGFCGAASAAPVAPSAIGLEAHAPGYTLIAKRDVTAITGAAGTTAITGADVAGIGAARRTAGAAIIRGPTAGARVAAPCSVPCGSVRNGR
jgi:hypothetical protein